jgi:hypothetical protein
MKIILQYKKIIKLLSFLSHTHFHLVSLSKFEQKKKTNSQRDNTSNIKRHSSISYSLFTSPLRQPFSSFYFPLALQAAHPRGQKEWALAL